MWYETSSGLLINLDLVKRIGSAIRAGEWYVAFQYESLQDAYHERYASEFDVKCTIEKIKNILKPFNQSYLTSTEMGQRIRSSSDVMLNNQED